MVAAIIGWFFLGLLCLVLLVLLVPSTIYIQLDSSGLIVKLRVLFIWVQVYPFKQREPRKKKEKKPKPKVNEEPTEEKEKRKRTPGEMWRWGKRLAKAGLAAMKPFLRHLRIRQVQVVIPVYAGDAADTAQLCGQVQAAVGTLRALLEERLNIKYKKLVVLPDFTGHSFNELYFSCKAVFSLGIMLVMGFIFLRRYLALGRRRCRKGAKRKAATAMPAVRDDERQKPVA